MSKRLSYLFIVGGLIGVLFSGLITIEKMHLLQNADYVPPCDFNPFISCGTIMATPQASVFGFPNSLIGLVGFGIVTTIGFALLAGAQFKRWYWLGTQIGLTFAAGFIYWLFFQSVFRIGSLCPYCMVVWTVTLPMFWYATVHNMNEGHLSVPPGVAQTAHAYRHFILAGLFLIIITSIAYQFWPYWRTLV